MRKIMISGRIVADAQKQVTSGGHEYVTFRIGNNEYGDEKGPDGKPLTYWIRVVSWNHAHINLAKYLTKGKPIIVVGNYKDNMYKNSKTGNCEIGREINADSIDFMNDGNNSQGNSSNGTYNNASKPATEIPVVTSTPIPTVTSTAVNDTAYKASDDEDDLPF